MPSVHPVVVFVAGPYRDERGPWFIQENIREAERCALWLWRLGIPALCPHKNSAMFDGAAEDFVWLQGGLLMLERCDAVVLCGNWQRSVGTCAEVEKAKALGIPVFAWGSDELNAWIVDLNRKETE